MSDAFDLSLIYRLQQEVQALRQQLAAIEAQVQAHAVRMVASDERIGALVEVLVDGNQIDGPELDARVKAAAIARAHAAREASAHSQNAWDGLGHEPEDR